MNLLNNTYKDSSEVRCSPAMHKHAEKDRTCFTHGELKLIASEFNKKSETKKIKAKTKKELATELLKAYKPICDKDQFCWVKHTLTNSGKISKLEENFRVEMPAEWEREPRTWLNTYDILYVLKQYEKLHKDFVFLNVTPIDFAEKNSFGRCIGDMLCDFDIHQLLAKKKTRFAIVFNTDTHERNGAHWIVSYCNLNPKVPNFGIYYYDSVANPTPKQIKVFMDKVVAQVNDPKFERKENHIQAQRAGTECGMFSIVFVTQCLKNIKFDEICKKMKHDDYINSLRKILYRPRHNPKS
jgi:hypothetical protein